MPRPKKVTAKRIGTGRRVRKVVAAKSAAEERPGAKWSGKVGPQRVGATRVGSERVGTKRAAAQADGLTKFQRFRRAQSHKGMKLLRIWVPDPSNPEFAAEAERQAKLLRGRPEEHEAIEFIMTVTEWPDT
jgi:Protein  of unknown function (DUF3018)